tara:strand:+ start:13738 stop:14241 length:504 start_codon:yes stop_codon:yes gene_type:complete
MKTYLIQISERFIAILAFIFPFTEISYYFGAKVFLSTDSISLKLFYLNNIAKLASFYEANVYLVFALMVGIFIICSRGTIRLTKFVRFNVIQAILLNIVCSCIGSIYAFLPIVLRESMIGILLANFLYLGTVLIMAYSSFLIFCGRYPKIPILTEAAKLQVQRGYLD